MVRTGCVVLAALSCSWIAGCGGGHGKYTAEGLSLAEARLNSLKAGAEYDMAMQAFLAGDLSRAGDLVERSIAMDGESSPAFVLLGRIFAERGDLGSAVRAFERAAELDGRSADPAYNLALAHERMRRPELALESFERATLLAPSDPQHAIAAAEMLVDLDRLDEAEALLARHPSASHSAGILQLRGHVAMLREDAGGAVELFQQARLLAPSDEVILEDLAAAQVAAGRFAEAELNLSRLRSKVGPDRRDLAHMRGRCLLATGRPGVARGVYADLVEGEGASDTDAWIGLGQASLLVGDDTKLRKAAARVVALMPSRGEGYVLWALRHRRQGDADRALESVETGIRRAGETSDLVVLRGMLLSELGRAAEAARVIGGVDARGRALLDSMLASAGVDG